MTDSTRDIPTTPLFKCIPVTLIIGFAIITFCEVMLFTVELPARDWKVIGPSSIHVLGKGQGSSAIRELPAPKNSLESRGRWVAMIITPLCWMAYLMLFDGLLTFMARRRGQPNLSPIRARPHRFIVAWLTSIPVWCYFDWANFAYLDAWRYHYLPPDYPTRALGYFIAFAAISPGMFFAAQWFSQLGLKRLKTTNRAANHKGAWALVLGPVFILVAVAMGILIWQQGSPRFVGIEDRIFLQRNLASILLLLGPGLAVTFWKRKIYLSSFVFGLCINVWAIVIADPVGCMTLWVGLFYLADPVSHWLGGPSLITDWREGRWGRFLALFAGGILCGLLWEFWNYWAITKWTYHLPFLGEFENIRYFEMPALGFLGFLPFAIECWAVLNVIIALMEKARLRIAEPLPDVDAVM
jgi:hypothetical protein